MSNETDERPAIVEIDVGSVNSVHELHELLSEHLGFPEFYGKNWDAFWDTITGLVPMPRRLVIRSWQHVLTRWPRDAGIMEESLADFKRQYPDLACDFELDS